MLYENFPEGQEYRKTAIQKYGKAEVEQSERAIQKLGKQGFQKLQSDFEKVNIKLFELKNQNPQSEEVQLLVSKHYQIIRQFWGTSHKSDGQAAAYAGLGTLYVEDERFLQNILKEKTELPKFALFLQQAMDFFAKTNL